MSLCKVWSLHQHLDIHFHLSCWLCDATVTLSANVVTTTEDSHMQICIYIYLLYKDIYIYLLCRYIYIYTYCVYIYIFIYCVCIYIYIVYYIYICLLYIHRDGYPCIDDAKQDIYFMITLDPKNRSWPSERVRLVVQSLPQEVAPLWIF